MTFDPSLRLKDALGVGDDARDREVRVATDAPGRLDASLLDAGATFDRLIERYSKDRSASERILGNRYYRHLSGGLSGILEYMAVERLFEVASGERYGRVFLDTPPTREALDFLEAPDRIVGFLDSGALKLALKDWFDAEGHLKPAARLGRLGRKLEGYLDDFVGLELLRDMADFFQAFAPLFEGFRARASKVRELLASRDTLFVMVAGPGEEEIPDLLFFARKLAERGHRIGPILVNRVHPRMSPLGRSAQRRSIPPTAGGCSPGSARETTPASMCSPGCSSPTSRWWRCLFWPTPRPTWPAFPSWARSSPTASTKRRFATAGASRSPLRCRGAEYFLAAMR